MSARRTWYNGVVGRRVKADFNEVKHDRVKKRNSRVSTPSERME